jgi:hypothetical protein
MLKDNIRQCDVCDEIIPKGEKYRVSTISKEQAVYLDLAPTTMVDSQGNIRLDICLECHLQMGLKGTETVN